MEFRSQWHWRGHCGHSVRIYKEMTDPDIYRLLIMQSAYLIWTMRFERVIGMKAPIPLGAVRKQWIKQINERVALDQRLISQSRKRHSRSPLLRLVQATWRNTIKTEFSKVDDWTATPGVLVGMVSQHD